MNITITIVWIFSSILNWIFSDIFGSQLNPNYKIKRISSKILDQSNSDSLIRRKKLSSKFDLRDRFEFCPLSPIHPSLPTVLFQPIVDAVRI